MHRFSSTPAVPPSTGGNRFHVPTNYRAAYFGRGYFERPLPYTPALDSWGEFTTTSSDWLMVRR